MKAVDKGKQEGFGALGMLEIPGIAYIKQVKNPQGNGYAVFSADGAQLAVFPTREAAYYTARQYDLEPFSVH